MLRLAQKAFAPGPLPFPLMHVNTTFKFKEMIGFRDQAGARCRGRADRVDQSGRAARRHQSVRSRQSTLHPRDEDRGAQAGARPSRFRRSLRRRAPGRGEEPRQGTSLLVPRQASTSGSRAPSGPNSGTSTTAASRRASRFAPSRCPTGPSSTSGSTSTSTRSRWCRSTTPRSVRWSSATAR